MDACGDVFWDNLENSETLQTKDLVKRSCIFENLRSNLRNPLTSSIYDKNFLEKVPATYKIFEKKKHFRDRKKIKQNVSANIAPQRIENNNISLNVAVFQKSKNIMFFKNRSIWENTERGVIYQFSQSLNICFSKLTMNLMSISGEGLVQQNHNSSDQSKK